MRKQFDDERNAYLPLAESAMKVFFAIDKLSGVEKVYRVVREKIGALSFFITNFLVISEEYIIGRINNLYLL